MEEDCPEEHNEGWEYWIAKVKQWVEAGDSMKVVWRFADQQ